MDCPHQSRPLRFHEGNHVDKWADYWLGPRLSQIPAGCQSRTIPSLANLVAGGSRATLVSIERLVALPRSVGLEEGRQAPSSVVEHVRLSLMPEVVAIASMGFSFGRRLD